MAEYIEREKAIDYLMEIIDRPNHPEWLWTDEVCGSLNTIPAADVRPVVFCRDCIHYKPQQKSKRWSNTTPMCSRSATIKMPPDGFCSFGVKREKN